MVALELLLALTLVLHFTKTPDTRLGMCQLFVVRTGMVILLTIVVRARMLILLFVVVRTRVVESLVRIWTRVINMVKF